MKLQGQNNLTGNITSSSDSYTFYGAKPREIGYLSNSNSNIQSQLNNITSNYLLSSTATNLYQPIGNYTNIEYVNTISSCIYNYYLFISSLSGSIFLVNSNLNNFMYNTNNYINNINNNLYNYLSVSGSLYSFINTINLYNNNNNTYFYNAINTISNYIISNNNNQYFYNAINTISSTILRCSSTRRRNHGRK